MFSKIIHWFIMPCSEATLEIEKQEGKHKISFLQRQRLKAHLAICKWCSSYNKKRIFLDEKLNTLIQKEPNIHFEEIDIQEFKENLKEKIEK